MATPHVSDKQYNKQACTLRVHCTLRVPNQNGGPHRASLSNNINTALL